jgi:thiol:disulfide interchange protein DsbC
MQVKLRTFVFGLLALIAFSSAHAESADSKKIREVIKQQLKAEPTSIVKSPIEGLYEVTVPPRIFYVSADGRYVLLGNLIDINSRKNLTQEKEGLARVAALDKMGEASMIVFAPKQVKHTITVFTDIDCGYCRKLHNEIEQYNKLGIKVRYMAYPRAGIGSGSYKKAVSVWCAKDKNKAMTTAKNGGNVPSKECDNPVEQQFQLGQELGVNGTPALVLENGQIYPGYAPASKLIGVLESIKK